MIELLIEVDFNSDEALYVQLQNQIIVGIAMNAIQEGDTLPSVRRLAETIGINMHTVKKWRHSLKYYLRRDAARIFPEKRCML